jgi:hypothetical protein
MALHGVRSLGFPSIRRPARSIISFPASVSIRQPRARMPISQSSTTTIPTVPAPSALASCSSAIQPRPTAARPGLREQSFPAPMKVGWLPVSDNGPMVADYIGVSYVNGSPFGVFAVAQALKGTTYSEAMYTTKTALPLDFDAPRFSSVNDHPVPDAKSDHEMNSSMTTRVDERFRNLAGSDKNLPS